ASFDNPDHVDIVIHNYRWRLGLAKGEPQYDALEQKLAARPPITVPAITIGSDFDGPLADGKAYANQYTGKHSHRVLKGIGHNVVSSARVGMSTPSRSSSSCSRRRELATSTIGWRRSKCARSRSPLILST